MFPAFMMSGPVGGGTESVSDAPLRVRTAFKALEHLHKVSENRTLCKSEVLLQDAAAETLKGFVTGDISCEEAESEPEEFEQSPSAPVITGVDNILSHLIAHGVNPAELAERAAVLAKRCGDACCSGKAEVKVVDGVSPCPPNGEYKLLD